jgi:hypothetical protein
MSVKKIAVITAVVFVAAYSSGDTPAYAESTLTEVTPIQYYPYPAWHDRDNWRWRWEEHREERNRELRWLCRHGDGHACWRLRD